MPLPPRNARLKNSLTEVRAGIRLSDLQMRVGSTVLQHSMEPFTDVLFFYARSRKMHSHVMLEKRYQIKIVLLPELLGYSPPYSRGRVCRHGNRRTDSILECRFDQSANRRTSLLARCVGHRARSG